jgi:hypothetical protein
LDEYELDIDDMEEYIDLYNKYNSYPPIVLDGDTSGGLTTLVNGKWMTLNNYTIIDGTHRANALKEMGFKTIICFVGKNKI